MQHCSVLVHAKLVVKFTPKWTSRRLVMLWPQAAGVIDADAPPDSAGLFAKEIPHEWGDFVSFDQDFAVWETACEYRPCRPEESVLYGAMAGHLETFLARQRERGRLVPRFVERELHSFLDCGILARGFLRVHCDVCRLDRVVPYSCKCGGFCPSCCGRRMADTAAHLVDRVLPEVPVRQWVLPVPFALRYRLA